ncbi:hypothetical protein ACPA9J_04050 [Pseudomonas aeruginosa]
MTGCVEAASVVPADGPGQRWWPRRHRGLPGEHLPAILGAGQRRRPRATVIRAVETMAIRLSIFAIRRSDPGRRRDRRRAGRTGALNAAHYIDLKAEDGSYPTARSPLRIPTLRRALRASRRGCGVPRHEVAAGGCWSVTVARRAGAAEAWCRCVSFHRGRQRLPGAALRLDRATVQPYSGAQPPGRLAFGRRCEAPPAGGTWMMGIELRRELTVTRRFTLGRSSCKVPAARL